MRARLPASGRGRRSSILCVMTAAICMLGFGVCFGLPTQRDYDEFKGVMSPVVAHTSWTGRDGAPQNISAIAESSDGFLWLGTPFGLFRFDGIEFARYPTTPLSTALPSIDIEALCADPAGGLWIGFRSGGISHLSPDGELRNYTPENHLGPNSAQKFVVRPDGSVWALGNSRLYRLAGDHWEETGTKLGLPRDPLLCLFFDRAGRVWTSTRHSLFVLTPREGRFKLYPTPSFFVADMAQTPDGEIWISDAWHFVRPLVPTKEHPGWKITGYVRMVATSSGDLWLAQDYLGVTHMPWAKVQPALVKEEEVSSEQTNAILQDREGDIWVGTSRGLDRFRSTPLTKLSNVRVEYYPSLAAAPDHGVWIATLARPLVYSLHGKLTPMGHAVGSSPIVCDDHGVVWMVDPITNQLTKWDHSQMERFPVPDEAHQAPSQSIGLDFDGALLVSFKPNGLWRFDGAWSEINDPHLPHDEPLSLVRDGQKRVWLGYANSLIAFHDDHGYHTLSRSESGSLGNVLTFLPTQGRLWAAGTNGLAYLNGGTFHRVSLARGTDLSGISGMASDRSGNLWLNSSLGILRIDQEQISRLSDTQSELEYDLLDDREGVAGTAAQLKPTPSAVADQDGALWFAISGQVISLQPEALAPSHMLPSVTIERIAVNGTAVMDSEHPLREATLASSRLKELQIDYVGIDMAAPEKIAYRYILEDEEKTWHDAGSRRQAFYTHLAPGKYRFRVAARSGNGSWSELAAPLLLTVTPAFYQTGWFTAAIVILTVSAVYLIFLLRIRYLTDSLKKRLKVRTDERLRIARDLHDTLLQSIHGLMLRFHFATETLPEDEPARVPLHLALQRADEVFLEARQRIEFLRDEVPEEPDFARQLTKLAEELDVQRTLQFRVVEEGPRRFLKGDVQAELCRIAREALLNTVHHGKARSAEISVLYGVSELSMKCSDTGIGIPADVLREGHRSGHWGLTGMRERATMIDARFQLWSGAGTGTQIEVRVPGRRAYRFSTSKLRWFDQLLQFRRAATGEDTPL